MCTKCATFQSSWVLSQSGSHFISAVYVPWINSANETIASSDDNFISNRSSYFYTEEDEDEDVSGRNPLRTLAIVHYVVNICIFIAILIYFPSRPPKPPSSAAEMRRLPHGPSALARLLCESFNESLLPLAFAMTAAANCAVAEEGLMSTMGQLREVVLLSAPLKAFSACLLCYLLDQAKTRPTLAALHGLAAVAIATTAFTFANGGNAARGAFLAASAASFAGTALAAELTTRRATNLGGPRLAVVSGTLLILAEHILLCVWWSVRLVIGHIDWVITLGAVGALNAIATILVALVRER